MSNTDADTLRAMSRAERFNALFDFQCFDYQRELVQAGDDADVFKAAVKPGRQVGKTVTGGAIAAERALSGHDVMILGPFEDTVKEMMEAATNHLRTAEEQGLTLGTEQRNKTDWQFINGGRLRARTVGTEGAQVRGKNPDVVLVDEAAYIKSNIFTEVIEPYFSTHNAYEFYLFSTPAGKSGYFYEKVEHDDSFRSPHWPSEISPLIDDEFLDEKRKQLDSLTFAQEYRGEFVDEADSYLPFDVVQRALGNVDSYEAHTTRILGVDPARRGKDRAVFYDIDAEGATRNIWSEEQTSGESFIGRLRAMQNRTLDVPPDWGNGTLPPDGYGAIVIEENAVGGYGADLAQANLGNVVIPIKTTVQSKQAMYQRLKSDIEQGNIGIPNHRRLVDELTSLEYEFTANGYLKVGHPQGGHDDFPDALALANGYRTGVLREYRGSTDKGGKQLKMGW